MKIRIHNNSIRLRLSQPEVAEFQRVGCLEERLEFGPDMLNMFRCALVREKQAMAVTARYLPGVIEIIVPESMAADWATSDLPSIQAKYTRAEKPIAITVEKDFECLHKPSENGYEAFPNPAAATTHD